MELTEREKQLYSSARSIGGRTIESPAVTFWMDKIKAGASRPTDSSGNAQMAYAQAQWALKNPEIEKQIREAGAQSIISPVPLYAAYDLDPSKDPEAPAPTAAAAAAAPAAAASSGSKFLDNIQSWLTKSKERYAARNSQPNVIQPLQPLASGSGGGLNLSFVDEAKKAVKAGVDTASGAVGVAFDPFGVNRGVIDAITGKPFNPVGTVLSDWNNIAQIAPYAEWANPYTAPIAASGAIWNTPTLGGTIKDTAGKAATEAASPSKEKSTVGDNIGMPQLGEYRSANYVNDPFAVLNQRNIQYSPWRSMALDKQAAEQSGLLNQAVQQQSAANAAAKSNLAMRGGLRSGASERIARSGANNLAAAQQGVLGQGVINRANIGMQGAQMDTDVEKFNAQNAMQTQQYNIQNYLNDLANRNDWQKYKYGEEMKMKGAGMTSQAIANAGKK